MKQLIFSLVLLHLNLVYAQSWKCEGTGLTLSQDNTNFIAQFSDANLNLNFSIINAELVLTYNEKLKTDIQNKKFVVRCDLNTDSCKGSKEVLNLGKAFQIKLKEIINTKGSTLIAASTPVFKFNITNNFINFSHPINGKTLWTVKCKK